MWKYFIVFLATLAVDTIPIFAPPAWILLVVLVLKFHLDPWATVIVGVAGSTLGRYIMSLYIPKVSSRLINRREDKNLRYLGNKLGAALWPAATFVFLYTLTPLSTTALFTATTAARVNPWHILPPFFCGRLITDGVMVYTGKYATTNIAELLRGQISWKSGITLLAGLVVIAGFLVIDWRNLLEKRRLRFKFKIFKAQTGN